MGEVVKVVANITVSKKDLVANSRFVVQKFYPIESQNFTDESYHCIFGVHGSVWLGVW